MAIDRAGRDDQDARQHPLRRHPGRDAGIQAMDGTLGAATNLLRSGFHPSSRYQHRGTRAIQRLVEFAPSTGGLALWVRHQDLPHPIDPGPVTTDGTTLYYSAGLERLPIAVQAGLIAHAVLHIALRHTQRYLDLQARLGDVDLALFNICADAIVNSELAGAPGHGGPLGSALAQRAGHPAWCREGAARMGRRTAISSDR
jgi:hypothetical protein